ncbi:uncharacterized protein BP01DRAFT_389871 [Aspergillus saccharolyticus JOP 1030-1]|uniref:Uncharacterized protein n=1 Tax=Aspergillus saccharolyticus JOP 1030-1 TaxID=1450539 RepID=A0A318ZIH9_9EURO|nr:hypothetical protein BP01DRAFT_389871 [Aspergillus saccharolyticus JOP 1030-1]PYH47319.1 hypothetical protein BP01DRAFT_389871 [Aspergillus saccharolyticus JOP 1030-1]
MIPTPIDPTVPPRRNLDRAFALEGRACLNGEPIQSPQTLLQTLLLHRETVEFLDVDFEAQTSEFWGDDDEEMKPDFNVYGKWSEAEHNELKTLLYMAKSIDQPRETACSWWITCPPKLEYVLIRGYERGKRQDHDDQVNALLCFKEREILPSLEC